jgi:hypothetical protein
MNNDELKFDNTDPTVDGKAQIADSIADEKAYERLEQEGTGSAYGEQAVKQHAKEALEDLYSNEFPIDDPPESFERYEAEAAVRHLRGSIEQIFEPNDRLAPVQIEVVIDSADGEAIDWEADWGKNLDDVTAFIEHSKRMIDVMATYGAVAESHIAALSYPKIHPEVREHAIETLAEMRDETNESKSLTAAIRDWWHGQ